MNSRPLLDPREIGGRLPSNRRDESNKLFQVDDAGASGFTLADADVCELAEVREEAAVATSFGLRELNWRWWLRMRRLGLTTNPRDPSAGNGSRWDEIGHFLNTSVIRTRQQSKKHTGGYVRLQSINRANSSELVGKSHACFRI